MDLYQTLKRGGFGRLGMGGKQKDCPDNGKRVMECRKGQSNGNVREHPNFGAPSAGR